MDTNLTVVAAQAIVKMLVMVLIGVLGVKIKVLGSNENGALSKFVLNITCPALCIASYASGYDPEKAKGWFFSILLGIIIHVLGVAMATILVKKDSSPDWQVMRMAIVYGNVGFMGIPLANALFGTEAVFYISTISLVYSIFIWSHGVLTMTGSMDRNTMLKKVFLNPNMVCIIIGIIIFFLRIHIPDAILSPIQSIGNCTTPISMVAAGAIIATSDIKSALKSKSVYVLSAIRLFLVPAVFFVILKLLPLPTTVELTAFVAAACPMGAMVTMFAVEHEKNAALASGIFALTTLLCIGTIPALIAVYGILG